MSLQLKSRLVDFVVNRSDDPVLTRFNLQKFVKDNQELLTSCYSRGKMAGVSRLVADAAERLAGDIAECGVYRGGGTIIMANILKEKKSSKHIYGFDSFEGMPEATELDQMENGKLVYAQGVLAETSLGYVNAKTRHFGVENYITFTKGFFEDTVEKTIRPEQKFCLVVIDPDQYSGTKFCLEFFYSKMTPGGYVLIDDYDLPEAELRDTPGVKLATDEFLQDKPETVEHLADSMYYFVKR